MFKSAQPRVGGSKSTVFFTDILIGVVSAIRASQKISMKLHESAKKTLQFKVTNHFYSCKLHEDFAEIQTQFLVDGFFAINCKNKR